MGKMTAENREEVKRFLMSRGINQVDFFRLIGYSRTHGNRILNGKAGAVRPVVWAAIIEYYEKLKGEITE